MYSLPSPEGGMFVENWLGPHSLLLHQPPLREVQMGQVAIMAALYQAWFLSFFLFFQNLLSGEGDSGKKGSFGGTKERVI